MRRIAAMWVIIALACGLGAKHSNGGIEDDHIWSYHWSQSHDSDS